MTLEQEIKSLLYKAGQDYKNKNFDLSNTVDYYTAKLLSAIGDAGYVRLAPPSEQEIPLETRIMLPDGRMVKWACIVEERER